MANYKNNNSVRVQIWDIDTNKPLFWDDFGKIKTDDEFKERCLHINVEDNSIYDGFEQLDLKDDFSKLYLYQTSEFIELRGKCYKVIKRSFSIDFPLMLNIYVEIDK